MPNSKHPCNLGHLCQRKMLSLNTIYHGTESASFLGPKIWDIFKKSFKKMKM